jgi:hypothetical protein
MEQVGSDPLAAQLSQPGALLAAELRPPRSGLSYTEGVDVWIDLHHSIGRMVRAGVPVFLTDNAVGMREEENLRHLASNLTSAAERARVVPFLTTKHELQYCLLYADRARSLGFRGVTVVGGDKDVGPPRCVPHAYELRNEIRRRSSGLLLGGWANPHRDVEEQAGFVAAADFGADFVLTQIVSHHSLDRVRDFLEALSRRGLEISPVFGVFFYRSAEPRTLERLASYFPVPVTEISEEFAGGDSPEAVCARSIRALRAVGAEKIYVSNLPPRGAAEKLAEIRELAGWPARG